MTRQITILVGSLAIASCSPDYIYRPAENATATIAGHLAADYQIPPKAPQGDVRLAYFGVTKIAVNGAPNQKQKAVHMRMIVTDASQAPWTVDTRQQAMAFPDGEQLAPAHVTTSSGQGGLPSVVVPARGERVIDLFYRLPGNARSASQVPAFTVVWHVDTPEQRVTEQTRFDRKRVEPSPVPYGADLDVLDNGWGNGEERRANLELHEERGDRELR
jgi:hypothetical protein